MVNNNKAYGHASKQTIYTRLIRNTTSQSEKSCGSASYLAVVSATEVQKLNTEKNLRKYIPEHNPRKRNSVHKAIHQTITNNPIRFGQLNSGVTVVCDSAQIDQDKNKVTLINGSIINGAQTQGEINEFISSLVAEEDGKLPEEAFFEVKMEILVEPDEEEQQQIAIARNEITSVQSVSKLGALKRLDDLYENMKSADSNWIIERSETDKDQGATVETKKLLQVCRLLMPSSVSYPGRSEDEIPAAEVLKPYKNPAKCLDDFSTWHQMKDNPTQEGREAKEKYDFTVSIAPLAWKEFLYWNTHPKWKGTGLQEVYKTSGKRPGTRDKRGNWISISPGLLFPVLRGLNHFTYLDANGNWTLNKPKSFQEDRVLKSAVKIFHDAFNYDPMLMGRGYGSYSALEEYPRALKDILANQES